ncbi:MAG: hypothetical protein JSS44_05470, partial [Proteobacteria bacterium]|nr:hypothetical protein [Pseudomonadota bacterium]
MALLASVLACTVAASTPQDLSALLRLADTEKSADNAAFVSVLTQLSQQRQQLNPEQAEMLAYLQGWQSAYRSDYAAAMRQLSLLADTARTPTVRLRASVTLVNVLEIGRRYEDAYARMQNVLDMLGASTDPAAREQALGVASETYANAGQPELGLDLATRLLAEARDSHVICKGHYHRQRALYRAQRYQLFLDNLQAAIDACANANEPIYVNFIRTDAARTYLATARAKEATELLLANRNQAQATHYGEMISEYDAVLAGAYAHQNDMMAATKYAQAAVNESIKGQITAGLAGAYYVLYTVAKQQGDDRAALAAFEKYAAADKGYLSDVSARALAYQMVHQQVAQKKAEIATLSQKNQVLKLQQDVAKQNMIVVRLGIALLLV